MKQMHQKTISEHIKYFMELFPTLTQEEADFIEEILKWEEEKRAAFFFAKRIFEEDDIDDSDK
jgi:hypothetical protein